MHPRGQVHPLSATPRAQRPLAQGPFPKAPFPKAPFAQRPFARQAPLTRGPLAKGPLAPCPEALFAGGGGLPSECCRHFCSSPSPSKRHGEKSAQLRWLRRNPRSAQSYMPGLMHQGAEKRKKKKKEKSSIDASPSTNLERVRGGGEGPVAHM